jgi:hypothetical protein
MGARVLQVSATVRLLFAIDVHSPVNVNVAPDGAGSRRKVSLRHGRDKAPATLHAVELEHAGRRKTGIYIITNLAAQGVHGRPHGDRSVVYASLGQRGNSTPGVASGRVSLHTT